MSRISYNAVCPECQKENKEAHLGFDMEAGKVTCDGENVHSYDEMPGEQPAAVPEEISGFKPDLQTAPSVPNEPMTLAEEAALDQAMQQAPRPRDFGSMVSEGADPVTEPEIAAPEQAGTQGEAIPDTIPAIDTHGDILQVHGIGDGPRVGLGEVVILPNGDAICGVRVSELWVSAMQAEGENRTPALNLAEYLQEIMDSSLLDWHSSIPGAR
jgi:hypothetical protein